MNTLLSEEFSSDVHALLKARASGFALASHLTIRVDSILKGEFHECLGLSDGRCQKLALVAVGGYGRRELMPYSDIDIMLLSQQDTTEAKEDAQAMLYRLWDLGINISHSYRSLRAADDDAQRDLQTRTLLMDSRFIAGNNTIFEEFMRDIMPRLLYRDKRNFVISIMREICRRHREAGESVYVLEPNIKEGRGGLRDIHSLGWLARSELRLPNREDYLSLWSSSTRRNFMKAYDYLLKIRAAIHVLTCRRDDVVSAELQDNLANLLGYRDTHGSFASEIMMRLLYRTCQNVSDALSTVMRQCGKKYFSPPPSFIVRSVSDHYAIVGNEIVVKDDTVLKDPDVLVEAFAVSARMGKPFSAHLEDLVKRRARFLKIGPQHAPQTISRFRGILRGFRIYETLKKMHDYGILGRIIPEFGRLRHLVILESFHRYTVDEHTLLAIRYIEELRSTKEQKLQPLRVLLARANVEVLFLSILLHDIGKGAGRSHEEAGYIMIKSILERLGLEQENRQCIQFLVRNHAILAKLALTRDIDAPETMLQLVEVVESVGYLDNLYLMTYADIAAVSRGFWNEWKASLLQTLYARTKDYLQGMREDRRVVVPKSLVGFVQGLPDRYLFSSTHEEMLRDRRLAAQAEVNSLGFAVEEHAGGMAECIVVTKGERKYLSRIVGVLSLSGFDIVRARLFTRADGLTIGRIVVSNWKALFWEGLELQIRERMMQIVPSDEPLERLDARVVNAIRLCHFEQLIELDNDTADDYTILEVLLPDRAGLLYDIVRCLYALNTDILSAVINTEHAIAQDVFYLQSNGTKLNWETCLSVLRSLQILSCGSE